MQSTYSDTSDIQRNSASTINGKSDAANVDIRDGNKSDTPQFGISGNGSVKSDTAQIGHSDTAKRNGAIRHQRHRQTQYRANRQC